MARHVTQSLFGENKTNQNSCAHIVRVVFESAADTEFDYLLPDEFWPIEAGQRVEVPFGKKNKLEIGFCVAVEKRDCFSALTMTEGGKKQFKLKAVVRIVDKEPLLSAELTELARWISDYYVCPLGQVLAAMVPAAVKKGIGLHKQKCIYLLVDSDQVLSQVTSKKQKAIVKYLLNKGAIGPDKAINQQDILTSVGCTNAPVKRLAEKQIIKIVEKTVLRSLPAIPVRMYLKSQAITLNEDQRKALAYITEEIESEKFGVTLLHGVTDSGKTELYIRAIEVVLKKGKAAIVLLPEIALTAQTVQRFSARFEKIAVLHSGLTASQRHSQWQKIKAGDADVVIGARSAIFAPLSNLGLVIVDEEHEPSYKQDTAPRYHGRDVAIKRAQLAGTHCILGSATPSLETLSNCQNKGHFSLVRLPKRVMNLPMPEMKPVDLRQVPVTKGGLNLISRPLAERLSEILAKREQAILLLNRRGYSNIIFCPSCKYTLHCHNCDVMLTFHRAKVGSDERLRTITGRHMNGGYAVCHYCLAQTLVPQKCPLCHKGMTMIGLGSQRLEEEVTAKFPQASVERVDSDSMSGQDYYRILQDFSEGRIDILAGTQMLAKGLHFPNVTLVGIISADTCLYLPDFRANERTFQLISQVAGRAGRSEKKGIVFVQTFLPEQPAIQFALHGDFDGFVREELKHRKACNLPPVWRLARIVMRDVNFDKLELASQKMRERLDSIVTRHELKAVIRGPMPAVINRIQRFHRIQIVIQAPEAAVIQQLFGALRADRPIRPTVKIAIDVDPVNLL